MGNDSNSDLLIRIERLESLDQIRQLASKYALSVDMRDFDALASLYTENTRVSREERGRAAIKRVFATIMRQFTGTAHQIGNHVIEFDDSDNADGVVYCRCEHEIGGEWVVMQMLYIDRYKRVDGRWHFQWRMPCSWYASDLNKPPLGHKKIRWPGAEPQHGSFHSAFPSWREFWRNPDIGIEPLRAIDNPDRFIETLRRGQALPTFPELKIKQKEG